MNIYMIAQTQTVSQDGRARDNGGVEQEQVGCIKRSQQSDLMGSFTQILS